jgi:Tfp pilus assembly protein FimT
MQSIADSLYEVSKVEGATKWEEFWFITLPMLSRTLVLVVIFTIVELVIVIAVIAILSSVLIPTFSELITKSKVASDTQLVKNLNISLATYECVNDTENKSLNDILNILESENGIDKDSIKPSSSGSILYDMYTNRFLLADKNNKVVFYDTASRKSQ